MNLREYEFGKAQPKTRKNAIRCKCFDCSGYNYTELVNCTVKDCALWPFRLGKDPFRKKSQLTIEQQQRRIEHMQKIRKQIKR